MVYNNKTCTSALSNATQRKEQCIFHIGPTHKHIILQWKATGKAATTVQ